MKSANSDNDNFMRKQWLHLRRSDAKQLVELLAEWQVPVSLVDYDAMRAEPASVSAQNPALNEEQKHRFQIEAIGRWLEQIQAVNIELTQPGISPFAEKKLRRHRFELSEKLLEVFAEYHLPIKLVRQEFSMPIAEPAS